MGDANKLASPEIANGYFIITSRANAFVARMVRSPFFHSVASCLPSSSYSQPAMQTSPLCTISIVLQTRRKSTGMSPHRSSKFLRGNCHRCRPHDLPDKCQTVPQRLTTLRTVFLYSQTQPLRLSKHGEQEFFRYSDNLRHKQRHS